MRQDINRQNLFADYVQDPSSLLYTQSAQVELINLKDSSELNQHYQLRIVEPIGLCDVVYQQQADDQTIN